MTQQIPDQLEWRGQTWYVLDLHGNSDAIPTSEALGFRTDMGSTACYRGRVDCFALANEHQLQLSAMVVNLAHDIDPTFAPAGATRQDSGRMGVGDTTFRFADHPIAFTGTMEVGRDADHTGQFAGTARLVFDAGRLQSADIQKAPPDEHESAGFV